MLRSTKGMRSSVAFAVVAGKRTKERGQAGDSVYMKAKSRPGDGMLILNRKKEI